MAKIPMILSSSSKTSSSACEEEFRDVGPVEDVRLGAETLSASCWVVTAAGEEAGIAVGEKLEDDGVVGSVVEDCRLMTLSLSGRVKLEEETSVWLATLDASEERFGRV